MLGEPLANAYTTVSAPKLEYNLNNRYAKFPPMTTDGRNIIASWQPGAVVHEKILHDHDIQSNWQYRKYMTANANTIRDQLLENAFTDIGYTTRLYNNTNTNVSKTKTQELSDLKTDYLTRKQLQSKMVVPSLTQAQLIQQMKQNATIIVHGKSWQLLWR